MRIFFASITGRFCNRESCGFYFFVLDHDSRSPEYFLHDLNTTDPRVFEELNQLDLCVLIVIRRYHLLVLPSSPSPLNTLGETFRIGQGIADEFEKAFA